jgi:hypothetical protein
MMQLVKDDIDAQRKGTAHVFWSHNIGIDDFKTRRWIHERLIPAMPVRINALHLCLPVEIHSSGTKGNGSNDNGGGDSSRNRQVIINMVKSFFMFALGPNLRSRLRIHTGKLLYLKKHTNTNTNTHTKSHLLLFYMHTPLSNFIFSLPPSQVPQQSVYIYYKHLVSNPIRCQSIQILVKLK